MSDFRKALSATRVYGELRYDEPMSSLTSFRIGGKAEILAAPRDTSELTSLLMAAKASGIPLFPLGAGANILVADAGIPGLVIDMQNFDTIVRSGDSLIAGAGVRMNDLTEVAASRSLAGLEFIHGMPGSVGGSVWMNARCYETSLAERIENVEVVGMDGSIRQLRPDVSEYSYKRSPFQRMEAIITSATFALLPGDRDSIRAAMIERRLDRMRKGHYLAPSVGSIFKNNRAFGEPTGRIIDSLGLRGFSIGDARVAEYHANIVINTGAATASEILDVIKHIEARVLAERGLRLEREVLLVGAW